MNSPVYYFINTLEEKPDDISKDSNIILISFEENCIGSKGIYKVIRIKRNDVLQNQILTLLDSLLEINFPKQSILKLNMNHPIFNSYICLFAFYHHLKVKVLKCGLPKIEIKFDDDEYNIFKGILEKSLEKNEINQDDFNLLISKYRSLFYYPNEETELYKLSKFGRKLLNEKNRKN